MNARRASILLVALAVTALVAQVLQASAQKLYPSYDEVKYLAISRDFAREGGTVPVIRCYAEGRCLDAIRPPLYQLFLAPVVTDEPRAFADAKLVEHRDGADVHRGRRPDRGPRLLAARRGRVGASPCR